MALGDSQIPIPGIGQIGTAINVANLFGANIPTPLDAIGGIFSKVFGGETIRPGLVPVDFSSFEGTFLEDIPFNFGGAVRPSGSFDNLSFELAEQIQFVNPAITREVEILRSMGFLSLADDLETEQSRLFNPSPSSPAAGRSQNQNLQNLLGKTIKVRSSILESAQNDPEFSSQFETNTGTSISDFVGELQRQDKSFAAGLESTLRSNRLGEQVAREKLAGPLVPGTRQASSSNRQQVVDDLGFKPEFASGKSANKGKLIGYSKLGEKTGTRGTGRKTIRISVDEFEGLKSKALADFDEKNFGEANRVIGGLQDFINTPGIDIDASVKSQFGDLFNSFADEFAEEQAKGGLLSNDPQPPPTDPQEPPVDGGTDGSADTLPGEDTFLAQQQRENDLITKKQRLEAIEGDENITEGEKDAARQEFNLGFAGFLTDSFDAGEQIKIRRPQASSIAPDLSFSGLARSSSVPGGQGILSQPDVFRPQTVPESPLDLSLQRAPIQESSFASLFGNKDVQNRGILV